MRMLIPLGALAVAACAASAAPRPTAIDRSFGCIQVHEAYIERGRALAARQASACADTCDATRASRAHAARLCAVAARLADSDALARCERGRETARASAAQATARCSCID